MKRPIILRAHPRPGDPDVWSHLIRCPDCLHEERVPQHSGISLRYYRDDFRDRHEPHCPGSPVPWANTE